MQITTTNFADVLTKYGISTYAVATQDAMKAWMVGSYLDRAYKVPATSPTGDITCFLIYVTDDTSTDKYKVQIIKVQDSTNEATLQYGYLCKTSSYPDARDGFVDLMQTIS